MKERNGSSEGVGFESWKKRLCRRSALTLLHPSNPVYHHSRDHHDSWPSIPRHCVSKRNQSSELASSGTKRQRLRHPSRRSLPAHTIASITPRQTLLKTPSSFIRYVDQYSLKRRESNEVSECISERNQSGNLDKDSSCQNILTSTPSDVKTPQASSLETSTNCFMDVYSTLTICSEDNRMKRVHEV